MFRRLSERFGPPVALTTEQNPGLPRRLRPAVAPAPPADSSLPGLHDLFRRP
jgi:hypothetical protein